jgi:hypothetical protein
MSAFLEVHSIFMPLVTITAYQPEAWAKDAAFADARVRGASHADLPNSTR